MTQHGCDPVKYSPVWQRACPWVKMNSDSPSSMTTTCPHLTESLITIQNECSRFNLTEFSRTGGGWMGGRWKWAECWHHRQTWWHYYEGITPHVMIWDERAIIVRISHYGYGITAVSKLVLTCLMCFGITWDRIIILLLSRLWLQITKQRWFCSSLVPNLSIVIHFSYEFNS